MNTKSWFCLIFFWGLLFAGSGTALAEETWATDPKTGVKIGWNSTLSSIANISWTGPASNNLAEGKGELTLELRYKDGTTLQAKGIAEMIAGFLDGKAVFTYSNGDSYDGYYKKGLRHGQGIYRYKSGVYEYYDGDWKNGEASGKGVLKFRDGRIYEGDFVKGQPEGLGIGKDTAGKVIHDGQWKEGMPVQVLKADKVMGIPWGANESEAKKILLQRPKTSGPYPFMSGKDGQNFWKGYYGPFAEFPDAWVYVHFYQEKMWQVIISWPLKEDQVLDRFAAVKKGLQERYGNPFVEKGKYMDANSTWDLGLKHSVNLQIRRNTTKVNVSDPTPQNLPFRVVITYYDANVAETLGLIKSDKPTGPHKDY